MSRLKKLLEKQNRDEYVTRNVEDVYNAVAEKTGRTPEEIAKIGGVESQHGKYSENMAGSRAKGLFQLMPAVLRSLGIEGDPESYNTQEDAMVKLTEENQRKLGGKPSIEDLYILHNQGLGRGKKIINAPDEEPIEKILPTNVIESNPRLYKGLTVGQSKDSIKQMLDERGQDFEFTPKIEDLMSEQPRKSTFFEELIKLKEQRNKK